MCYSFAVAFFFTSNVADSAGIVLLTGSTLTILQWGFEIVWDKHARHRIRNALSGQHGRISGLVRFGRGPCSIGVDKHEPGPHRGEGNENSFPSENAS